MPYYPAITARKNRKARGGRIADALSAEVDTRIAGKTPSVAKPMINGYSMQDYIFAGIRNPDCWVNDVPGITAMSVGNSYDGDWRGCTLIAPDVVLMASHVDIINGTDIYFLTNDGNNTLVTRQQTARQRIGSTDIMLGKLASAVPNTIAYAKVFTPTDYSAFTLAVSGTRRAALGADRERKATVRDHMFASSAEYFHVPINATRLDFYEELQNGDSGNAAAFIVGDDLVLMCPWSSAQSGGYGESVHYYRDQINAAMLALGSVYQLTEVTLSL